MIWPEDNTDFQSLVNNAMSDRRSELASKIRDALGKPDIIGRTLEALETIVASIDEQLESSKSDDHYARSVRARDGMYDRVLMYRAIAALAAADG